MQLIEKVIFKSSNIILYLTCLILIIICLSKHASADSNSLNKADGSSEEAGEIPITSSTKSRKAKGRRTTKPKAVRSRRTKFPKVAVSQAADGSSEKAGEIPVTSSTKGRKAKGKQPTKPKAVRSRRTKFPKVAVFQADGVFWPYKVERDIQGPFAVKRKDVVAQQMEENSMRTPIQVNMIDDYKCEHEINDNTGKLIKAYDGIKDVLQAVKKKKSNLALIQTTTEGATLLHMINLFDFDLFKLKEVDDDPEIVHIKSIKSRAEVEFKDIIYFGTNETTLQEIQDLGATTVKINLGEGLKMGHIEKAEKLYSTRKQ